MQDKFLGWYATMNLGEDSEHALKRWKAIEALVPDLTHAQIEQLVRLSFRIKLQMSAPEVADLRGKLAGGMTPPGDEELLLLAASALAWAMDAQGGKSPLAATMVATASCGGLRAIEQPMDLVSMSEAAAWQLAEAGRRRPSVEFNKPLTTNLDKAEVTAAVKVATDGDPGAGLLAVVASVNKALASLARRQATVEGEYQKYTRSQDEELDILWWLQGGHSSDLQSEFSHLTAEHRPLAIARELATLTKVLPGPTAVPSILSRCGVTGAPKMSVCAAVRAMPAAWLDMALTDITSTKISHVTTPISLALSRRKELGGSEGWAPIWSMLTAIDETAELEPMRLAEAAYREFVLLQLG